MVIVAVFLGQLYVPPKYMVAKQIKVQDVLRIRLMPCMVLVVVLGAFIFVINVLLRKLQPAVARWSSYPHRPRHVILA
jgi:hypothetical protein